MSRQLYFHQENPQDYSQARLDQIKRTTFRYLSSDKNITITTPPNVTSNNIKKSGKNKKNDDTKNADDEELVLVSAAEVRTVLRSCRELYKELQSKKESEIKEAYKRGINI